MAPKNNALPVDIDHFFEGTSTFFPPLASSSPKENQALPERSNDRTIEETHATPERANRRTLAQAPDRVGARSGARSGPVNEPVNSALTHPSLKRSKPTSEPVTTVDAQANAESLPSILARLQHGRTERLEKTERYSFEIYPEQKEKIEDFLYQYKKRTGEKLSASKLLREAIDRYFQLLDQHGGR